MSHVDMQIFISTSAVQPFTNKVKKYSSNLPNNNDLSNEKFTLKKENYSVIILSIRI